jgi:hypothetical protein
MKRIIGTTLFLLTFLLFTGVSSVFAAPNAYIDPNTGGMLFQVLAVVFATLSGFIFLFASRIKMAFARLKRTLREKSGKEILQEEMPPQA